MAGEELKADGEASSKVSESSESSIVQRRSRWVTSLLAYKYVTSLAQDDEIKVRDSDRATTIALLIVSALAIFSLFLPPFAAIRNNLLITSDILVGAALLFYLANRFGIVNTLQPRQASLTWQLMLASAFAGIFITVNSAILLVVVLGPAIANCLPPEARQADYK